MNSPDPDMGQETGSDPAAAATVAVSCPVDAAEGDNSSDPLLDVMERWDECYRRGDAVAPESLGVTDPVLFAELRERIDQQKRLYERLKIREARSDWAGFAPEARPKVSRPNPTPRARTTDRTTRGLAFATPDHARPTRARDPD
jgi:hypothetical protein